MPFTPVNGTQASCPGAMGQATATSPGRHADHSSRRVSARNPVGRTGEQNESSLLVLPSALVTMGEEPPEPRSPVACAFWWSLVPGPGESGEYDIRLRRPLYGRYRLAER